MSLQSNQGKKYRFTKKFKVVITIIICVIILLVIVTLRISCSTYRPLRNKLGTNNSSISLYKREYKVKKASIKVTLSGLGTIVPIKIHKLYFSDVFGTLEKINVRTNDRVKIRDLIAELSPSGLKYEIEQQKLKVEGARLRISQFNDENKYLEGTKKSMEIEIEHLNAIIKSDGRQTEKEEGKQVNDIEDSLKKLKIKLAQLQFQLDMVQRSRQIANVDYKSSLLSLNNLNSKIKNCKLVSRTDGIIISVKKLSETDFVKVGDVIAEVVDSRDIVMRVTSKDLRTLSYGMSGSVIIGGRSYRAVVYKPSPGELLEYEIDDSKVKSQVFVKVDNIPRDIKLGDQMNIKLVLASKSNLLVVPQIAIKSDGASYWAEALQNGKVKKVEVKKGLETLSQVEILEGLKEGDTILFAH